MRRPVIYCLNLIRRTTDSCYLCRTVAYDLDEALLCAARHFGSVKLASSGTCAIPLTDEPVYGRGRFLEGKHDHLLQPATLESLKKSV